MGLSVVRKLTDEIHRSSVAPELVEYAARIHVEFRAKNLIGDADDIHAQANRAFHQGELKGARRPETVDAYRRYTLGEVVQAMRTERYKLLVAQYQGYVDAEAAERAKREEQQRETQKRIEFEIARERELCPHLWDIVLELQGEIAALRA